MQNWLVLKLWETHRGIQNAADPFHGLEVASERCPCVLVCLGAGACISGGWPVSRGPSCCFVFPTLVFCSGQAAGVLSSQLRAAAPASLPPHPMPHAPRPWPSTPGMCPGLLQGPRGGRREQASLESTCCHSFLGDVYLNPGGSLVPCAFLGHLFCSGLTHPELG